MADKKPLISSPVAEESSVSDSSVVSTEAPPEAAADPSPSVPGPSGESGVPPQDMAQLYAAHLGNPTTDRRTSDRRISLDAMSLHEMVDPTRRRSFQTRSSGGSSFDSHPSTSRAGSIDPSQPSTSRAGSMDQSQPSTRSMDTSQPSTSRGLFSMDTHHPGSVGGIWRDTSFRTLPGSDQWPANPPSYSGSRRTRSDPPSFSSNSMFEDIYDPFSPFAFRPERGHNTPPPGYLQQGLDPVVRDADLNGIVYNWNLNRIFTGDEDVDQDLREQIEEERQREIRNRQWKVTQERVMASIRRHQRQIVATLSSLILITLTVATVFFYMRLVSIVHHNEHEDQDPDASEDPGNSTTTTEKP